MITYKTEKEIEVLKQGGKILSEIIQELRKETRVGISTKHLDALAADLIKKRGGIPSFLGFQGFPACLCVCLNEEIVHGIPSEGRIIKNGDLVSLDLGLKYPDNEEGLYTDMAITFGVGEINDLSKKLIRVTKEALDQGIKKVKPGNTVQDISKAIQQYVEKNGFSVVQDLVGHGVGFAVHEDPQIPNFYDPLRHKQPILLKPGMVIALEPMVNVGGWQTETLKDSWTVVSADRSLTAHFEHTMAVTDKGCIVITQF